MKTISCTDMGQEKCDFVARGANEQEVLEKLQEHAKVAHDMKELPPEVVAKAKRVMKDE